MNKGSMYLSLVGLSALHIKDRCLLYLVRYDTSIFVYI